MPNLELYPTTFTHIYNSDGGRKKKPESTTGLSLYKRRLRSRVFVQSRPTVRSSTLYRRHHEASGKFLFFFNELRRVTMPLSFQIVLSVVVVGCFATAQLHVERTRYRPINPFRFDSFPSSSRVPTSGDIVKAVASPNVLDDHQIRLMLDAHIVCLTELKGWYENSS